MAIKNKVLPIVICSMLFSAATVALGFSTKSSLSVQAASAFDEYQEKVATEERGSFARNLAVDDVIVFAAKSQDYYLSGFNSNKGSSAQFDANPKDGLRFTVEKGSESNSYSFKLDNGSYLAWSSGVSLKTSTTKDKSSSWSASFSGTTCSLAPKNATLGDRLYFAKNDKVFVAVNFLSKLFGNYDDIRLYKLVSAGSVEDKAENYSDEVMEELITVCDPTGSNTNAQDLKAAWESLREAYNALDEETKAYINEVVPDEHGDSLEMMVYQYLFIINKYGSELNLDNFMKRTDINAISPFIRRVNERNSGLIPTVTLLAVLGTGVALGAYVIKAKKED